MNEDAHRSQMGITAIGEEIVGLNVTTPSFVQAPVHQTRYYTADGVYWAKLGFHSDTVKGGTLSTNLSKLGITYKNGQRASERWWGGPLGATGEAALIGDNLKTNMQDLTDSDGHLGSYGEFTFPQVGTGGMRIYRNDVALTSAGGNTAVDGSTEASYRIERSYDAQNVFPSGGRISSVWETEPAKANVDGSPALLPLANLVWSARSLDLSGRLTMRPQHRPGRAGHQHCPGPGGPALQRSAGRLHPRRRQDLEVGQGPGGRHPWSLPFHRPRRRPEDRNLARSTVHHPGPCRELRVPDAAASRPGPLTHR